MCAMKKTLKADFVHIGVMGVEIPHTHIHVIPLMFDTQLTHRPTKQYKDPAHKEYYHQQIVS